MLKYVIINDSCMDLPKEERALYQIEKPIPGSVNFPDGSDHLADIDWEETSYEDFYHDLDNKHSNYRTGLPNQYLIMERIKSYFEKGQDVIAITLSSNMSGTYNAFLLAKEELEKEYKGRKLLVVDSRRYSAGISLLSIYASINREKGLSIEENVEDLENKKLRIHQIGILDNLFFLHRSGRISKAKAFFGNLAGVKPMADFCNETGMPAVLANARGYKSAYKYIEEFIKATIGNPEDKIFVITQSIREPQAEEIKKRILGINPNAKVIISRMGQSNGVNVGPGLAATFYLADENVSINCEKEKEILLDIIGKK